MSRIICSTTLRPKETARILSIVRENSPSSVAGLDSGWGVRINPQGDIKNLPVYLWYHPSRNVTFAISGAYGEAVVLFPNVKPCDVTNQVALSYGSGSLFFAVQYAMAEYYRSER